MNIERRSFSAELRREAQDSRKVVGYAAVFDSPTQIMDFWEVVRPGAFTRSIAEKEDVRGLIDHNSSLILGRTKSGTLRLAEDAQGLRIEIDPPDTQAGRDILVSLERGDVDQMSFAFAVRAEGERWSRTSDGRQVRELLDLQLFDVSIVTFPAYADTSVAARSWQAYREVEARVAGEVAARERLLRLRRRF